MDTLKNIFTPILLLLIVLADAAAQQTNSQNYVISRTYKQAGADANDISKVNILVQYIDGLGRPSQSVAVGQSPAGTDVVIHMQYDAYGRQVRQYLPFTATGKGSFKTNGVSATNSWYIANTAGFQAGDLGRPYTETTFESSPLNRPLNVRAPGNKSDSSIIQYLANTANEVKLYYHSGSAIAQNGYYSAGTLYRTRVTDENDKVSNEYTDLEGRVICKTIEESGGLSTYYVYDDYGLLRAVLQPEFQTTSNATNFAFQYDYDGRGRLIKKQIPGGGIMEMVYDNFDRLVYARDANQTDLGVWSFTKYDALNRPIATGEIGSSATQATLAGNVDADAEHHEIRSNALVAGYSLNKTAPKTASEAQLRTITFYDDYDFQKPTGFDYSDGFYSSVNTAIKGQPTGGRVRMLPGNGSTGDWLTTVTYYDEEYRLIQTVRDLYDLGSGAKERISMQYKYDLALVVSEQKTVQTVNGNDKIHIQTFEYDHADRLLSVNETINDGLKSKTAYTVAQRYNTLGQLQSKWFHAYATNPTKYRRRTDYTYNIRSWLTDAKTKYQQTEGTDLPFYTIGLEYANGGNYTNGNISSMKWDEKDLASVTKGLSFSYDGANRLTGSAGIGGYADTESGITFDKNGNIKTLLRAGDAVDNLSYSYLGNRLSTVNDASGNNTGVKSATSSYSYDANGNMTFDGNRGAVLTYNYLNLPKTISIGGKSFAYDYDASGTKHKYYDSNYNPPTGDTLYVKYAGAFEYDASNVLKRVATSEGQLVPSDDTLRFDYFIKDHLGNVRVVFNEKGDVLQQTDYYPFGLEIDRNSPVVGLNARNGVNRYLYNGKELQVGTGLIDYGARMYMPELGRWGVVDPLSESDRKTSPYSYVFNNPLRFIDPDGRFGDFYNKNGEHLGSDGFDDDKVYVAVNVTKNDQGVVTGTENSKELSISHSAFIKQSATVYAESSIGYNIESKEEMFAIASVHQKNDVAYGVGAPLAKKFMNTTLDDQPGSMQIANAAVINAVTGGTDYSNGAKQWDGAEQAMVSKTNMDKASNGRFMYKMNVMGWEISDANYKSWQSAVDNKFGSGKFSVPQTKTALHNYGGMKNTGKIRLNSSAQYGLTIFWKEK